MIFIRHGESEANTLNIWGGDYPLTKRGQEQALMVPKSEGLIVASGLRRAQETACIAYPGRELIIDETFNEIYFGDVENERIDFEGITFRSFIEYPQRFHTVVNGDDIESRARKALERARLYPSDTIFFTHGTLMQAMRSLITDGTVETMHRMKRIDNCEVWHMAGIEVLNGWSEPKLRR